MSNQDAVADNFAIALYRFGVQQWEHEFSTDFGQLRRLRSAFAERVVSVFPSLEPTSRTALATALLYRGHPGAIAPLALELSPAQQALLEEWDAQPFNSAETPSTDTKPLRRSDLSKELRTKLTFLGEIESMDGRATWRHRFKHGRFSVLTYVDVGGRVWDLSYHHDVLLDERPIRRFISFLAWLGIGPTKWTLRSATDGAQAAELLAELGLLFVSALPSLLPSSDLS